MEDKLKTVESVQIDEGTFKYILVKVYDPDNEDTICKYIVRGNGSAEYHGDIYETTTPAIEDLGLECECVGGGRIKHDPNEKTIHVYGYSQGYGRADHLISCKLLKEKYPDYNKIDFSNDVGLDSNCLNLGVPRMGLWTTVVQRFREAWSKGLVNPRRLFSIQNQILTTVKKGFTKDVGYLGR